MKRVLAVVLLGFGITAGAVMASVDDEIRARIQPVGEVCLQGEECGEAAAATQTASAGPRSGSEVYNAVCMACHTTGAAGAPVIGDSAAWAPRIAQGMETDRKSTRLNSSHVRISYAVFCLKKKKKNKDATRTLNAKY